MDQRGSLKVKYAFIERVGAKCAALDVPFFLEPLAYDDDVGDEKSLAFAKAKPEYVKPIWLSSPSHATVWMY